DNCASSRRGCMDVFGPFNWERGGDADVLQGANSRTPYPRRSGVSADRRQLEERDGGSLPRSRYEGCRIGLIVHGTRLSGGRVQTPVSRGEGETWPCASTSYRVCSNVR